MKRALAWGAPAAVLLLAAVLRLWNLGNPHSLVFDETFYVKDAWSLWNNGYESTWGDDPDKKFNAGITDGFTTDPSYVVHPQLGKWLIGLGMALFGADNSFGWRCGVAIAGILIVLLVMLIAQKLFHSTTLTVVAGGLMAIDGHAITLSRVSLLDNFVTLFTLAGFGLVLLDRERNLPRLMAWMRRRRAQLGEDADGPTWGPTMWNRPYLLLAGLAFGLACSVKWSGMYFLAAFAVYVVVMDALDRRRVGLPFWFSAAVLKQAPATFILMVPIAIATYITSWMGWIVTSGGYYRNLVTAESGLRWTGPLSWVPDWAQSLWAYHVSAYQFHVGLVTPHSYQANPLTWL
ncbi:MAG: phospholipid carrier-dependent glycosyltransferase, partial [Aurantimicrobium sp.]